MVGDTAVSVIDAVAVLDQLDPDTVASEMAQLKTRLRHLAIAHRAAKARRKDNKGVVKRAPRTKREVASTVVATEPQSVAVAAVATSE